MEKNRKPSMLCFTNQKKGSGMTPEEFFSLFSRSIKECRLHLKSPLMGASFSGDNAAFMMDFFSDNEAELSSGTPVFVRQFTDMVSDAPIVTDPGKFLPIKRMACFFIFNGKVSGLSKEESRSCYNTDSETGEPLPALADIIFIDADKMIEIVSSS